MDNESDKTISFIEDGTCNYCNEALKRMPLEYYPSNEGKAKLDEIMNTIKIDSQDNKYDCIVGVSGGLDSSYVLYLGHLYGLRMLAVHVDDGLDTEIAQNNIKNICDKTKTDLVLVKPDFDQYKDLLLSFIKASVPNLAMPQDNIIIKAMHNACLKHKIKYSLSGVNFSMESILERSSGVNACDKKHIIAIHKIYGNKPIKNLFLTSLFERYVLFNVSNDVKVIKPLNYIEYDFNKTLSTLSDFCGYVYCGGKHYESILCRFLQCWYLPEKYNFDKRKSHFSSLIVSGQMTREEAISSLSKPAYISEELKEYDFNYLANYFGLKREDFDLLISAPPKQHTDYPISNLNTLAPLARRFRKYLQ